MTCSPIFIPVFALLGAFLWLMAYNTAKEFKGHKAYFPRQKMHGSDRAFIVVMVMAGALSIIAALLILISNVKE